MNVDEEITQLSKPTNTRNLEHPKKNIKAPQLSEVRQYIGIINLKPIEFLTVTIDFTGFVNLVY